MTRRDYEMIAAVLRKHVHPRVSREQWGSLGRVASDLADAFERANPRFNRDRFLDACNLPEEP